MQEHNRNLSSIVGTIQDEGPPAGVPDGPDTSPRDVENTAGSAEAETFIPTWTDPQRSSWRPLSYLLLAALVLAAAFIFVIGGREGSLAESADSAGAADAVLPAIVGEPDAIVSNQEIHEGQILIMKQLEELSAAIEAINASNDQYRLDNQGVLEKMQGNFQHQLDEIAAAVSGLQAEPDAQEESAARLVKGTSDAKVVQPESNAAPVKGGWVVNVSNSANLESIEKLMNKLHKHGIPAETQEVVTDGKPRYRLRIPGFTSRDEARDYAAGLDASLGLRDPWVSRR